jgi:hypothetical protein
VFDIVTNAIAQTQRPPKVLIRPPFVRQAKGLLTILVLASTNRSSLSLSHSLAPLRLKEKGASWRHRLRAAAFQFDGVDVRRLLLPENDKPLSIELEKGQQRRRRQHNSFVGMLIKTGMFCYSKYDRSWWVPY